MTASTTSWVRAWDFLTYGHPVRVVAGSDPGRDAIVGGGGDIHLTSQLTKFSLLNIPNIVNSKLLKS